MARRCIGQEPGRGRWPGTRPPISARRFIERGADGVMRGHGMPQGLGHGSPARQRRRTPSCTPATGGRHHRHYVRAILDCRRFLKICRWREMHRYRRRRRSFESWPFPLYFISLISRWLRFHKYCRKLYEIEAIVEKVKHIFSFSFMPRDDDCHGCRAIVADIWLTMILR